MIDRKLVSNIIEIVRKAGAAILDIYNNADDVAIQKKSDNSPLTIADKTANEIICANLEQLEVQFPIISEENKTIPYKERKKYSTFWLVDPLDGTKEFIKKNGEFTVNIALVKEHQPVLGVVFVPCQDKLYWGLKGVGSFVVENGVETALTATTFKMSDTQLNVVSSRSHLNEATKNYVAQLNEPNFVPVGSSLKFMLVASGAAALYPRFIPCMEWDTAAAQIIVEEAGGTVISQETQQPLTYNKESLLNPYFIAFGKVKD